MSENDDKIKQDIAKILADQDAEISALEEEENREIEEAGKPRVDIKEETVFSNLSETAVDLSTAFDIARAKTPEITDYDKEQYLKDLLNDIPFTKVLEGFGGKFKCQFRTRNIHEQEAIVRQLKIAVHLKDIERDNSLVQLSELQYYTLYFSLLRVNDTSFPGESPVTSPLRGSGVPFGRDDAELRSDPLYAHIVEFSDHLKSMNQTKLHAIIELARQFEVYTAKLASLVTAENF